MTALQIRTPEGITFSFQLAGPVVRGVAWLVDFLVIVAISQGVGMLAQIGGFISPDFAAGMAMLGYFVVSIGYGVAAEWAWRGQTIGKRMLRLRVIDAQGLRLQFHQVLLRNLMRFVDALPAFYLVGGLACCFSRRAQRLGDLAANTIVVHNPRHLEPDLDQLLTGKFNSLRQFPHLAARLRQRTSAAEATLALQALVRRDELDPAARLTLFAELAAHFKIAVTFPPEILETMPDEQFVRNLVDLLFRARATETATARATPTASERRARV